MAKDKAAKRQKRSHNDENNSTVANSSDAEKVLNELKHAQPVLNLRLDKKKCCAPDITLSTPNLLENMLYPLSVSSFLSTCFRKKAVHISSNNADRAKDIIENYMFNLDSRKIFEETSSDSVFLWIPSKEETNSKISQPLQSIEIQDPNTAHILHTCSNYASYCRAPPELEQPLVSTMLRDVGLGLGQYDPTGDKLTCLGRGEVETFIGTEGHLTDWHTDFQENFTIQLSGKKKWTLKQGTVKHPLRGTTPHYKSGEDVIENQIKAARLSNSDYQFGKQDLDTNAFGDETEIIMEAGDILYFPAGMFHKVETLEYGVSINVSLMGCTYANLVCKTMEHLLLQKDEWREVICAEKQGMNGDDVVEKLKGLMASLPDIIQQFSDEGAANSMLPPFLREPPKFELVGDDLDEEYNEEDKNSDSGKENDANNDQDMEDPSMSDSESMDSMESVQNEKEDIIDINDFESPSECSKPSNGTYWRMNPLASLIKVSDIKSFYMSEKEREENEEELKNQFVLNINFAGNDMHESSLRKVFRDDSGFLEKLCTLDKKFIPDEVKRIKDPPSALIYYGFLI